jgi:hypothetical protein
MTEVKRDSEMFDRLNTIFEFCPFYECTSCPLREDCDSLKHDYVPFKFFLEKMKKQFTNKTIVGKIVFEKPKTKPLRIGGLMKTPYDGLYLVWTPERKLEEVQYEIACLKNKLSELERKEKLLL